MNIKIQAKIMVPISLISIITGIGLYIIVSNFVAENQTNSMVEKARSVLLGAESAREFTRQQQQMGVFDTTLTDKDDILMTVPIFSAIKVAGEKANELGYKMKVPKKSPRNPDNQPDEFELRVLNLLESGNQQEHWEIDPNMNAIRYFRPVKLTEDCMKCHGDPNKSMEFWGNSEGKDITGVKMEGWNVGEVHGAFEIMMDMAPVQAKVAELSGTIGLVSGFTTLLLIAIAFVISNNINSGIKKFLGIVNDVKDKVANGNLNVAADKSTVPVDFHDVIDATNGLIETFKAPINDAISNLQVVSSGNQASLITSEYKGDFNKIKDSINTLIEVNNRIKNAAASMARGDMNFELQARHQDDVMINSILKLRAVVGDLIGDVNKISNALNNGNLSYRANVEGYNGDFAVIMNGLNSSLVAVSEPIQVAAKCLSKLGNGDVPKEIDQEMVGDFNMIKSSLNQVINAINSLIDDAQFLSNEATKGNLSVRVDASKLQGDYRKIVEGINTTLDFVVSVVDVSGEVMIADKNAIISYVNSNLLSMLGKNASKIKDKLPAFDINRLVGTNVDVFHRTPSHNRNILENLNTTHKAQIKVADLIFNLAISPIRDKNGNKLGYVVVWGDYTAEGNFNSSLTQIVSDMTMGQLSKRIETNMLSGQFTTTADSINNMLDSITKPLILAANYIDQISKGTIPETIKESYNGDFDKLRINLNTLLNTLTDFVSDMKAMEKMQNEGDIEFFLNTDKFNGVYSEMAKGVNAQVKSHIEAALDLIGAISAYGQGNFDANVKKYPGKKAKLNEAIDAVQNNLKRIASEITSLISEAKKGHLAARGNAQGLTGEWNNMITGLNDLLEAIVDPITQVQLALESLSNGDLTTNINGNYNGDFKDLQNRLNNLSQTWKQLITEFTDSVRSTSATSHQLASTAETLAAASQEQSAQADEVATAVEEMSRTISENAMSASHTADLASNNGKIAEDGSKVVQDTVNKMKDIAGVVQETANNIQKLGDSSKQIGDIISVIDDIADQTNLLALNAAIEAARAGEQGRGFAVVADEVRKLAERTTGATKQIAMMIKGIQNETEQAVHAMHKGTLEVKTGIELADRAGASLNEILGSTQSVMDMISQIASASEEQSATSEEISKNVLAISHVSSESAHQVEEIANSADNLSQLMENLNRLMAQFNVGNSTSGSSKTLAGERKLIG